METGRHWTGSRVYGPFPRGKYLLTLSLNAAFLSRRCDPNDPTQGIDLGGGTYYAYSFYGLQWDGMSGLRPDVTPPSITSARKASGAVGTPFNYKITASNSPAGFHVEGLPAGLSFRYWDCSILGTPAAAGAFDVTLTAVNGELATYVRENRDKPDFLDAALSFMRPQAGQVRDRQPLEADESARRGMPVLG